MKQTTEAPQAAPVQDLPSTDQLLAQIADQQDMIGVLERRYNTAHQQALQLELQLQRANRRVTELEAQIAASSVALGDSPN